MPQWEYQITVHELPERPAEKEGRTFACNQDGLCFVHDAYPGGIQWLEALFRERARRVGSWFNQDTMIGSSFAYGRR